MSEYVRRALPFNESNIDWYRVALVEVQRKYPNYELRTLKLQEVNELSVSFIVILRNIVSPQRPLLTRTITINYDNLKSF